ncbi:hypothetical protein RND61_15030 [Streptomyces sp. TRM76323]|uniref:Uncharacterized protein n=1 Tax=Streptomyces tamarix TaxID=3078565 RepID=A0ABU3QLU8_9ACTN|nr:hypothetical protein [Streptomyces tamarix]MDT9683377.1 hypothetical protein [Streptomyces tamarix]
MSVTDIAKTHNTANKVKISQSNTDIFMADHGIRVIWEKSFLCACRDSNGSPRTDCPICHGLGWGYLSPEDTMILFQQSSSKFNMDRSTQTFSGTALATAYQDNMMSVRDRITLKDSEMSVSVLVKVLPRHIKNGINLKYDVVRIQLAQTEKDGGLSLDKYKIDLENNRFYPTEDMTNSYISFNLIVRMRYYVIDNLRNGRYTYEGDARLPERSQRDINLLPNLYLMRREDNFTPDIIDSDIAPTIEEDPRSAINESASGFFTQR